jgi:hypothetical protein
MAWTWRCEDADGTVLDVPQLEVFSSKGDAESWLGETWRDLRTAGVAQVVLLDGDRVEYGPMGLDPE